MVLDDREGSEAVLLSQKIFLALANTNSECMTHWLLASQIHKVLKGRGHKTFVFEKPHFWT